MQVVLAAACRHKRNKSQYFAEVVLFNANVYLLTGWQATPSVVFCRVSIGQVACIRAHENLCDCRVVWNMQLHYTISRPPSAPLQQQQQQPPGRSRTTRGSTKASQQPVVHSQTFSFTTQVHDYKEKQQQLIEQLQAAAEASRSAAVELSPAAATGAGSSKGRQQSNKGSKRKGTSSAADNTGGASSKSRSTSVSQQQEQKQQSEEVKLEIHQQLPEESPATGDAATDSPAQQCNDCNPVIGAGNGARAGDLQDEEVADRDGLSSEASSEQADDFDSDSDYVGGDSNQEEGGDAGGRQHARRSSDRPSKRTRVFDV